MTQDSLEQILSKFPPGRRDSLLPILQEVQELDGYLDEEALTLIGKRLNIPSNKVYGVATFYDQFRFHPRGRYHIRICRGTACHLIGSSTLQETIETQLRGRAGQVSKDRRVSLEVTQCMGSCQSGPVVTVNDRTYTQVTAADLENILHSLKDKTE